MHISFKPSYSTGKNLNPPARPASGPEKLTSVGATTKNQN